MFFNPYIAGNPIDDDGFFGREDIFREVVAVLQHPRDNGIVLYGQRRIGKTSILLQLTHRLASEGNYSPVYFDLMDKAGKLLREVLYELARQICVELGLAVPDGSNFDEDGSYFHEHFLPEALAKTAEGGLVLLFDEFDVLDSPQQEQAGQTFFPYLRRWMSEMPQVQFVFVIGRRPEDLSISTMSTFKTAKSTMVALLAQRDAEDVIQQSEIEGSLRWADEAVAAVWQATQGHPYFIQLVCSTVWEEAHRDKPAELPTATSEAVAAALEPAMVAGNNAFVWLWDALPPAERIVMAAIAVAPKPVITQEELIAILNQSGVRLIVNQLEIAPETLQEWGLLQQVDDGYRFTVPLLRRWVVRNRPLARVKDELDRVEPMADRLFHVAQDDYLRNELDEAERQLRRVLEINPNHLKGRVLLGQILSESERLEEAIALLEEVYAYDARSARPYLVQALLKLADRQKVDEAAQLAAFEQVLAITPTQRVAIVGQQQILERRRRRRLAAKEKEALEAEAEENWGLAVAVYEMLLREFPEDAAWREKLEWATGRLKRQQQYNEARGAIEAEAFETAIPLLIEIVAAEPTYKDAAQYLLKAIGREDVVKLRLDLEQREGEVAKLAREAAQQRKQIERLTTTGDLASQVNDNLKKRIDELTTHVEKLRGELKLEEREAKEARATATRHRELATKSERQLDELNARLAVQDSTTLWQRGGAYFTLVAVVALVLGSWAGWGMYSQLVGPQVVEVTRVVAATPTVAAVVAEQAEEEAIAANEESEVETTINEEAMNSTEKVQIRWFVGLGTGSNEDQIPIQEEVVATFNTSQDQIELVVEFVANELANDVLKTQIASGNAPNIIGPFGVAPRAAFTDALLDLQPLIDASAYDLSDFDPAMVDFYNLESHGQVSLPFVIFPSFIFFNKDLFDEAGLSYPPQNFGDPYIDADGNEKPWNLDTVRELGMLLTVDANGNDATSPDFDAENIVQFGFGYQWADIRGRATMFGAGSFADASGNAVIPDHWRTAMHWYHDAMWADSFYPNGVYGGSEILGGGNWFESGNMAMDHVHLWYATCCTGGLEAEWDIAVMPAAPDGSITAKMHADTFAILKGSENPEAAFEVLSYLIGPAADKLTKLYGGLPARLSLQGAYFDTIGNTVEHLNGRDINWDVVIQSMAYADNPNHEEGMPNELQARDVLSEFDQLLQNDSDFDVDAGLDEMRDKLQEVFDQAN